MPDIVNGYVIRLGEKLGTKDTLERTAVSLPDMNIHPNSDLGNYLLD